MRALYGFDVKVLKAHDQQIVQKKAIHHSIAKQSFIYNLDGSISTRLQSYTMQRPTLLGQQQ